MALGFKGGFAAFMDGYNKAEERNYTRDRQAKEDAWVQSQRDVKLKEQERDETLRADIVAASKDKVTSVEQQGPLMQQDGVDMPLPNIEQSRPQTEEEIRRSAAAAYRKNGKLTEAFANEDSAKKLGMEDYAIKFGQFRSSAQNLPIKDQVAQAIRIFNDSPNAGTIGEPRYDANGAVTFDAYNKVTGQKVTKTFADPKRLMDDLHAYYSQASWAKDQADLHEQEKKLATENSKLHNAAPGTTVYNGAGKIMFKVPDRLSVGGVGGGSRGGGGGGGDQREIQPDTGARLDPVKTYEKIYENLFNQNEKVKESGVGVAKTDEQVTAAARALAQKSVNEFASNEIKQRKDGAISGRLAPLKSGMQANPSEYAAAYQQILHKGVTAEYLASIGFEPPKGWTGRR